MRFSWNLGRLAGIDIYLHPTFLLLLTLPRVLEGGPSTVLLVLATFGCVLLHELGHALMARRYGIETADITLYPIGGVARLLKMPRSPGAELAIALAGPLVNVLIAATLAGAWVVGALAGVWEVLPVEWFVVNLLLINLVLAAFNLIPAFPMDGGRVLRAALSGWLGRVRATLIAAGIGRTLAFLFGFYNLIQGNWQPAILAAFIYYAAGAERNRVLAEERDREEDRDGDWTAPPGYRWVSRGNGLWQLSPIPVTVSDRYSPRWR